MLSEYDKRIITLHKKYIEPRSFDRKTNPASQTTPNWRKLQMVGELKFTIREMAMHGERYLITSAAELTRRL